VATVVTPARWYWLPVALCCAGGLAWWIWLVAGGCDVESEVKCGWQPVLVWINALLFVGVGLLGVGAGALARRFFMRRLGGDSANPLH
jgi:hypothetical protein